MSKTSKCETTLDASAPRVTCRADACAALLASLVAMGCAGTVHPAPATAASPWPEIVSVAAPPDPVDCSNTSRTPTLTWERAVDGALRLAETSPKAWALKRRGRATAPAAFPGVPEVEAGANVRRSVVAVEGGWLAAIDRGEFDGSGLYAVAGDSGDGGAGAERVDAVLAYPVRWITRTRFGIVGVAGLCHGEACTHSTAIYRVDRLGPKSRWQLYPLALLPGCPAAVITDVGGDAVVVAGACGSLYRVAATDVTRVATWPSHLYPYEITPAGVRTADEAYYVSFGAVAARFTRSSAEWYVPRACPRMERGPDNVCRCVSPSATP